MRNLRELSSQATEKVPGLAQLADFKTMEEIRSRVDESVKDPEVAEKLKAYYNQFCKRPTFNDHYLETFNRPNVELVDVSATQGVEAITEQGLLPTARSTRSIALSTPVVLRLPQATSAAWEYRSTALVASRSTSTGRTACGPCMA